MLEKRAIGEVHSDDDLSQDTAGSICGKHFLMTGISPIHPFEACSHIPCKRLQDVSPAAHHLTDEDKEHGEYGQQETYGQDNRKSDQKPCQVPEKRQLEYGTSHQHDRSKDPRGIGFVAFAVRPVVSLVPTATAEIPFPSLIVCHKRVIFVSFRKVTKYV